MEYIAIETDRQTHRRKQGGNSSVEHVQQTSKPYFHFKSLQHTTYDPLSMIKPSNRLVYHQISIFNVIELGIQFQAYIKPRTLIGRDRYFRRNQLANTKMTSFSRTTDRYVCGRSLIKNRNRYVSKVQLKNIPIITYQLSSCLRILLRDELFTWHICFCWVSTVPCRVCECQFQGFNQKVDILGTIGF